MYRKALNCCPCSGTGGTYATMASHNEWGDVSVDRVWVPCPRCAEARQKARG
jgi:hypothetical protein